MSKHAIVAAALGALLAAGGAAQTSRPDATVPLVKLPETLLLPAVGNLDAVRNWQYGRIERVVDQGGSPDVFLDIRTWDGRVVTVAGPPAELAEFARVSNWVDQPKQRPGASDYVERMVAFDFDASQRLIAMISLEPMSRNKNRLARALRG